MRTATLTVCGAALVLAWARPAAAQPEAVVEGPGYKIGEGTVLHPSVGVEAGVISNVFYEDSGTIASPVARLIGELAVASAGPQRTEPRTDTATEEGEEIPAGDGEGQGKVDFRAGLRLTYNEYLSGDDDAKAQRSLGIGLGLRSLFFPRGRFTFGVQEDFLRDTRPINTETSFNAARDVNHLRLWLRMRPLERTISATVRYENTVDLFEDSDLGFADRMHHTFGLRGEWRWLPITLFYLDASLGVFGQLGTSTLDMDGEPLKTSSNPLRLQVGTATAITELTTLRFWAGYGRGFYNAGPDYSGVLLGGEFGYRYSPLGRFTVGYEHDFRDSLNANFYTDDVFRMAVTQQIKRILVGVKLGIHLRNYRGVAPQLGGSAPDRDDFILDGELSARYYYRDWLAITGQYMVDVVATDFRYALAGGEADDPSYLRHEVTAGIRAAF